MNLQTGVILSGTESARAFGTLEEKGGKGAPEDGSYFGWRGQREETRMGPAGVMLNCVPVCSCKKTSADACQRGGKILLSRKKLELRERRS